MDIFYFANINSIGGVESFFYYLSKKYKGIVVYYKNGDYEQIKRLSQNIEVHKYTGQSLECNRIFFNYNLDIIDKVKANEYIEIIHVDYKALHKRPNVDSKITKYIGVSKQVCDSFKEITGRDIECIYNPVEIDKPKKVLNLVSATRLTKEKGRDRMIKLGKILDSYNIPYIWTIFTNDTNVIDNPNIVYMKPRLDIINFIANADYLVQLSDTEAYCYSVVESLLVGTPVIVTNCPAFEELGIKDKEHGFILDFELDNVLVEDIYKGLGKFSYSPPKSEWNLREKSDYNATEKVKLCLNKDTTYTKTKEILPKGTIIERDRWYANYCIDCGIAKEVI